MGILSEYTGGIGGWGTMISRCAWCGEIVSEYETDSEGRCTIPIFDCVEGHRCPCEDDELEDFEGMAVSLNSGGWSSCDMKEIQSEYGFSDEEIEQLKTEMEKLESAVTANKYVLVEIYNQGFDWQETFFDDRESAINALCEAESSVTDYEELTGNKNTLYYGECSCVDGEWISGENLSVVDVKI